MSETKLLDGRQLEDLKKSMFWVILWIYVTFLLSIVLPYITGQYQPNLLVQNHGKLESGFLFSTREGACGPFC